MKHSDKELEILYLDNHLLVVGKPSNLLTQPSPENPVSLEAIAKEYIRKKFDKEGNVFLHTVHRLDKEVSGIVVFARSQKALSRLNSQMRDQEFTKIYHALVQGDMEKKSQTLVHYLLHGDHRAIVTDQKNPQAKRCELTYTVIKKKDHYSLLKIELKTGRYHQIRAQLSAIGHPIVGDRKYGGTPLENGEIYLHQSEISFIHPTLKKRVEFKLDPNFGKFEI